MSLLSKLSTKIKILILVVYSLIAVVIAFLIANAGTKSELLSNYSKVAYDDYIKVSYRFQETRQSAKQLKAEHETSTYKAYAYIEKRTPQEGTKVAINNITLYVAGENVKGNILFDEPSSSTTKSISTTGTVASFGSNILPNNVFVKKYVTENENEVLTDNLPVKLYFTLKYEAEVTKDNKTTRSAQTLKYTVDLTDVTKQDFSKFEERKIVNNKIENLANEPYDIEVIKTITTSSNDLVKDRYSIKMYLNSPNLSINKIENLRVEVFGKVKNDSSDEKNEFEDYIRLYTYCGGVISSSYSSLSSEIDQAYETSDLYVIAYYKYANGDEKTLTYKVKL